MREKELERERELNAEVARLQEEITTKSNELSELKKASECDNAEQKKALETAAAKEAELNDRIRSLEQQQEDDKKLVEELKQSLSQSEATQNSTVRLL